MFFLLSEQGSNRGSVGSLSGGSDFQGTAPATFNMMASADHARLGISCHPINSAFFIVQELCESRGGRPEPSVLTSLLVFVDVKNY